jgi:hypothetical protein
VQQALVHCAAWGERLDHVDALEEVVCDAPRRRHAGAQGVRLDHCVAPNRFVAEYQRVQQALVRLQLK